MDFRNRFPILLALVLVVTAALWVGVAGIGVNADDYEGLAAAAPIHTAGDLLRPFGVPDPNPSYFRPVSAITMSADFFFFGWNGPMFHLTSLLAHLLVTLLVFYVARDIFMLTDGEALVATLFFGIAASHESNLTVDAMRVDVMVALFVLLTLLLEYRARVHHSWGLRLVAVFAFALAILAKESSIVLLFLLPALLWDKTGTDIQGTVTSGWAQELKHITPYVLASIALYFYRAHFTTDPLSSQALSSEGSNSLVAAVRNGAYALGYTLLPLDFETATSIIARYGLPALVSGGALTVIALSFLLRGNTERSYLWKPLLFMLLTGGVLLFSFERWRVYLPSVGLFIFLVVLCNRNRTRHVRLVSMIIAILLGGFHIARALSAQAEWRDGTAMKDTLVASLTHILDSIPQRPITLGILVCPSKLGGASVLMPGISSIVQRAEADRVSERNRQDASVGGVRVSDWEAVLGYAEDRNEGFRGLIMKRIDRQHFEVSAKDHLLLYPSIVPEHGIARRDLHLEPGMTFAFREALDSVCEAHLGAARKMLITIKDTAAILISYVPNAGFVVVN